MIKHWATVIMVTALCWAVFFDLAQSQQTTCAQPICTQNISRFIGGNRWDWTIYIDPLSEDLQKIKCVEYTLHRLYPNRVRIVCARGARDQPFALSSNGWGMFRIELRVLLKDKSIRELGHELHFEPRPPRELCPPTC